MQQFKPWHVILLVAALGAIIFGAMSLFGGSVPRATRAYLIDVVTGDVFIAPVAGRRMVSIPAIHPTSGERTLLPLTRDENGDWMMSMRYVSDEMRERGAIEGIDLGTGAVTIDLDVRSAPQYRSPLLDE